MEIHDVVVLICGILEAAALNSKKELEFILNGKNVEYNSIKKLRTKVELAPGWVNYNKNIHDL